jgi:hypothetical protein
MSVEDELHDVRAQILVKQQLKLGKSAAERRNGQLDSDSGD